MDKYLYTTSGNFSASIGTTTSKSIGSYTSHVSVTKNNERTLYSFDVPDTENIYPMFTSASSNFGTTFSFDIYNVWLETKENVIYIQSQDDDRISFTVSDLDNLISIIQTDVLVNDDLSKTYTDVEKVDYDIDKLLLKKGINKVTIRTYYTQGDDIIETTEYSTYYINDIDNLKANATLVDVINKVNYIEEGVCTHKNFLSNILTYNNKDVVEYNGISDILNKFNDINIAKRVKGDMYNESVDINTYTIPAKQGKVVDVTICDYVTEDGDYNLRFSYYNTMTAFSALSNNAVIKVIRQNEVVIEKNYSFVPCSSSWKIYRLSLEDVRRGDKITAEFLESSNYASSIKDLYLSYNITPIKISEIKEGVVNEKMINNHIESNIYGLEDMSIENLQELLANTTYELMMLQEPITLATLDTNIHSPKYNLIKSWFNKGYWNEDMLLNAVEKHYITEEEMNEIIG